MSRIVGIDLGTSTSEIAVLKDGIPYVIPNHLGEVITPSVVGISESGLPVVGGEAKDQLLLRPEDTVMEVKRLMGSGTKLKMGGREYSPEEVSSFILKYLLECAERHLGEKVERAVITVPAYFSDEQRRATVEAGILAGVRVERIINEPTAASLDYGIDHMEECRNVLVYDLGGGTLDVTVLEMFEGVLDVKASSGNNRLGGKDFDESLMDFTLDNFRRRNNVDVSGDLRAMARLKEACEKCKIALSNLDEYTVVLPFFAAVEGNPVALEERISREMFEEVIREKVDSTGKQIALALGDAGLTADDIDVVLLVGGSTRIPYVKMFIEKTLGKPARSLVDPDLAVVRGAALQAGILNEELSSEKDILITDVCPYTLGTSILDYIAGFPVEDVYDVIIPRNTTIPVVKEKIYGTAADGQQAVEINAYQGENRKASFNNSLGKFRLTGIPPAPAFEQKIRIAFGYDVNGILNVEGTIVSTGVKAGITVETTGVKMLREVDLSGWKDVPEARRYRAVVKKAEKLLENGKAGVEAIELEGLVRKIKEALVSGAEQDRLGAWKEDLSALLYALEEETDD